MNNFFDKYNSLPLAQRVIAPVLLMVALAIGFWFLAVDPIRLEITGQKQQLAEIQREKDRLEQLKKNRAIVLAQLETLKRQLLIAQEKLPQDAEIPSLLQRIHNQAKTAGLEILVFKRLPDRPQQFYVEIPVEMELAGTYDELANFLFYIGRMTRIVNMKDLSLVRTGTGLTGDGDLKIKARGTTFRYAKPAEGGVAQ